MPEPIALVKNLYNHMNNGKSKFLPLVNTQTLVAGNATLRLNSLSG